MTFQEIEIASTAEQILKDPGGHFNSPMAVVWEPHLDHEARVRVLYVWLDRERLLYRGDRAADRVGRMREIEVAIRTLADMSARGDRDGAP